MSAGLKKRRGARWPCELEHRFFLISLVTFCIKAESNARPARPNAKKMNRKCILLQPLVKHNKVKIHPTQWDYFSQVNL
jgi:hypothetical protein